MSENGVLKAEQRVREMNRVTRQYSEQGNDFMRQDRQRRHTRQSEQVQQSQQSQQQPRFEPVPSKLPEPRDKECAAVRTSAVIPDGEKMLMLLIVFLLIKEKADVRLLLALAYILL